jgi:hypothetical protein
MRDIGPRAVAAREDKMKKSRFNILAGTALCLTLVAGCDEPMPVTLIDPPSDGEAIVLEVPMDPAAPAEELGTARWLEGEELMVAEAEEAIRQLEHELDALQITPAVVWAEQAAVREQATQVSLMMSVLVRGERVSVLGGTDQIDDEQVYVHVRMRNGATGYVKQQELLLGDIEQLYCFDNSPFFAKPDSTTKPQDWLRIGTPAFMIASKGAWIEVVLGDGRKGWMLSSDLADDTAVLDVGGS